ncbi:MAG: SdpI family protein [Clostridia bacterium]|nr:SdpI family protein [Clostridia bacterium]
MIKKNLKMMIVTSFIILLPIIFGLVIWNKLPEEIPIHWNINGEADGFAGKTAAVILLPAFMLAIQWVCMFATGLDPKNKDIDGKPLTLVLWICPVLSLVLGSIIYAAALGHSVDVKIIMPLIFGAMFVIIGNYMPKCKQNYSLGIKLPWTLNDEENWNKTHRFAGFLWVAGGIVILATSFLGSFVIFMGITLLMVIVPTVYSYRIYKKKNK